PRRSASAWQPLTPHGLAAFAEGSFGRLFAVQFVMAMLVAASVLWLFLTAWCPVIDAAMRALPEKGEIKAGRLQWQDDTATNIAESPFLAIVVDPDHRGEARSTAHVQLEFGRFNCRIYSLFGFVEVDYPRHHSLLFNRTELVPWWGAWRPALLAAIVFAVVVGLLTVWWVLTALYFLPTWLLALYANRRLSLFGSWRLAGAALMPGALFMTGAIVVYGRGFLSLLDLSVAYAVHFLLGWVYLFVSAFCLPPSPATAPASVNPFQPTSSAAATPAQNDAQRERAGGQSPTDKN
ncbi:MAG: hypothetical protein ACREIC_28490, partial [Limisphaerales bacterium]